MGRFAHVLAITLSVFGASALTACGGSGGGDGYSQGAANGQIVLTSIAPNPMQGCGPHAFTITGEKFETVSGTTATVTFRAISPAGYYPFAAGSSDRASVTANVTSDTTITGFTPPIVICGVAAVTCEVDVMLESGVFGTSTGVFTVVINAPTIASIVPNPIPAALPTPFTVTGTGFGPVGGPATVRFTGDNGALLWKDGTKNFADVVGTVVNSTTITGITPIATVCDVALIGASVQIFFPDGCCTLPTPAGFVSFAAPTITSVSLNPVPAAVQQNGWVINGTNFGPAGTQATVRFVADNAFPLFGDGTQQTISIPALVGGAGPAQTLTLTTPLAAVCGIASRTSAIRVISPFGSSCIQTATGFLTFAAPTIVGAQAPIPGAIATPITITGTNFGPAGSPVIVRFLAAGGASIFDDGTSASEDVPGVVGVTVNTVNVTTPLVTACTAAVNASVRVFAPAGGACVDSVANYLTFNPPTITSIAPAVSNAYPTAPNTTFTITSATASYGPLGSPVEVRFTSANGLNLFGNGSVSEISVLGNVASATTITGTLPSASLCGVASETVNVRVTLQNGSCQTAASLLTYNAPTITGVNGGALPAIVPSSNPVAIVLDGAGFAPLSGVVQVRFLSDPAGPPLFGDGTLRVSSVVPGTVNATGTSVTVIPPHATVSPNTTTRSAFVQVTLPNGACATSVTAAVTYTAPTLTAIAPTGGTLFSATQTGFTLTGANFGPVGSEVAVRFNATSGTPFGNGTQSSFEVPALVTNATTITGNASPLAALCGSPAVTTLAGTARVIFQDGTQSSNTAAFTYVAPAITSVTAVGFGPTPVPFTIVGTGFAPVGTIAQVTFIAQASTPLFGAGSQVETTVTGVVTALNTVTGVTPSAIVCNVTPPAVDVRVTFYGGSCATALGALTPIGPTITGALSPASVPATIQTQVTITGTGFGTTGSLAQVVLSISGTPPTSSPFMNASSSEITVTGTVGGGGTTITFFSPLASACTADVVSDLRVRLANGSCSLLTPNALTFVAPTVTTNNLAPTPILSLTPGAPNPYTITGTNFAPLGAQVLVRYTATNPIFGDGTSTQIDVSGTVLTNTTIQTALPIGRVCAATTAQARVVFPNGACADSPLAFVTWAAPTVTTLSVTNGPAFNPGTTNLTGTNFPPTGTPVVLHWSAATPIFAGGTSTTFEQFTTVSVGGAVGAINAVPVPVATTCATVAANLSVEFGNPNAAGCVIVAPQFTFNAPTATLTAATAVDAVGPAAISAATLAGTNLPPNATLTVRFVAATGTPFEGGSSAAAETVGVVNGTGTGIAIANVPGMAMCQDPSVAPLTTTAALSVVLGNGCVVPVTNALTYTAPVLTLLNGAAAPLQLPAMAPPAVVSVTGTNFGAVPVGSIVTVRLTATTPIFSDGTSPTLDLAGLIAAANTVTFRPPAVTLCGVATASADLGVLFPGGSCDGLSAAITFNAPQVSAAPTGFAPQNLAYAGVPFTVTGPGGVNAFGPIGATVNVRFSVAAGTPFLGGTSVFAVVPGTITSATTIVGTAPAATAVANTIASVNVRAEFEDGSCTNTVTTSYLRTTNRVSVTGGGNDYLLDQSPALSSTVAVAGATASAFAPALGRVYVTTGATGTVRIVDMNAGTTPGTGVPALLAAPSIAIAGNLQGIAIDTKNQRAWVVNTAGAGTVHVIDLGTNQVLVGLNLGFVGGIVPTGRIYWDSVNDRMLVPGINPAVNAADQITVFDATLAGVIGTAVPIAAGASANPAASLDWTGGLAVDPVAGLLFLAFNDADALDVDSVQARDLANPNLILAAAALAAGTNPSAVMAASPNTNRFFVYMAAPTNTVQAFANNLLLGAVGPALAVAAPPTDIAISATVALGFLVEPGAGATQAFNTATNANVGGPVATAGGGFGATTSP